MKAEDIKTSDVKYLSVRIGVYFWEDIWINDVALDEDEDGSHVPFADEDGYWSFTIDLDNGRILGWKEEVEKKCPDLKEIETYIKCCDICYRTMLDKDMKPLHEEYNWYAPNILDFDDRDGHYGYGDYIGLKIDSEGNIKNWPKANLDYFIRDLLNDLKRHQAE